ncbi:MAG: ATP-binding protein [Myxococcota bacterium]
MTSWWLLVALGLAAEPRWRVDRWTMREGLPQNSVTDLVQSRDGDIWLTTFGGIARFDGFEFRHFTPANTEGLDANRFVTVAESPDGTLWFGSENRGAYRLRNGRFTRLGPREVISDLAVDGEGRVWAATPHAFVELSAEPPRRIPIETGRLWALAKLDNGQVVGSGFEMPWQCPTAPTACLPIPPDPRVGPLQRVGQDEDGRLWLHGINGAYHFDPMQRRWLEQHTDPTNAMLIGFSFAWQAQSWLVLQGKVWPSRGNATQLPLPDTLVRSHLIDQEGGLWLGLDGGGLWRIDRAPVDIHLPNRSIGSVARDAADTLWIGTCDSKLERLGKPMPPIPPGTSFRRCTMPWADDRGKVFVRTIDRERGDAIILQFRGEQWQVVAELPISPPERLFIPQQGPWFVYDQTLFEILETGGIKPVTTATDLGGTRIRPITGVRPGELWVVLDDTTLLQLRHGRVVRQVALVGNAPVRDVLERPDMLWLSTYGAGLLGAEGSRVIGAITPRRGMCDYALSHIFDTADGTLWFNTNRGLGRVNEDELRAALLHSDRTVTCTLLDSGEANGASGVLGADGHLWAPTIAGLAEVDPNQVFPRSPPVIKFRDVRLGDLDLLSASPSRGGPGEDGFAVGFVATQFHDPRAVRYRYRLVGRDDHWSDPTTARHLYWSLEPGHYRFEVRAIGPSGIASEPVGVSFERVAATPETLAFQVGLPVGLVGAVALGLWAAWWTTRRHNQALTAEIGVRKRAERALRKEQAVREKAQQALHDSRRLEAIGRLAGGIAHDFNNLLTIVSSHASQLQSHLDPPVRQAADSLGRTVERAATLTRRLLVVGRKSPTKPQVIELGRAMRRFLPLLSRLIREDIELRVEAADPVWVSIDRGRLDQIVTNLVVNGRDAIEGPGIIQIRVTQRDEEWAVLTVEDDGVGITAPEVTHLFEPYFTTKTASRGTGLGLATVQGAVSEAGGDIEVHSEVGVGTCMTVLLPLVPEPAHAPPSLPPRPLEEPQRPKALRVLLVDDQHDVARSLGRLVASLDWIPHLASSLGETLAILEREPIDVLVTDVVMPGANGPEVLRQARSRHPELPVIFMSGHPDGLLDDLDESLGRMPFLRKPFAQEDLVRAVQDALDA